MKNFLLQIFIFFLIPGLVLPNVYATQVASELPAYSRVYDESRDPIVDGREALKLAQETQRKVLIEVGGDWCSWCHVLDGFIKAHP
jgi:thioredoxin-related protein